MAEVCIGLAGYSRSSSRNLSYTRRLGSRRNSIDKALLSATRPLKSPTAFDVLSLSPFLVCLRGSPIGTLGRLPELSNSGVDREAVRTRL